MVVICEKLGEALARLGWSIRDHTRKAVSYLRALSQWLWESRFFWFTILVGVGVPFAVLMWCPHEHIIRRAGLVLQLAGIGTVWWGIRETRKLFKHPTFWMQARDWIRRHPKYGGRVVAAVGSFAAAATASARGSAWTNVANSADLEKRIEALEKNLTWVRDDLSAFEKKTADDIRKQDQAIRQERQTRDSADQAIREKLETTETGGLHISAMGAIYLLIGVTMSTIPAELVCVFGP